MAKQRIPVGPLAPPPKISPRATPVDTFHSPDVPLLNQGPTEMEQLAHALGDFQPTLMSVAVNARNRQSLTEETGAKTFVLSNPQLQNRKAFKDAVDAGQIPEARSPWFLRAAEEQIGRIEGDNFDVALRESYAKSSSKHDADITDFVGSFTAQYMKDHGLDNPTPAMASSLQPKLEQSVASLKAQHLNRWENEQSQKVRENLYKEVSSNLDAHLIYSSPEALGKDIETRISSLVTNGLSGTDANKAVIDAITDKARDQGDATILDMLDKVSTGNGKLGQIQYARDKRDVVETSIYSHKRSLDAAEWATREHTKKAAGEDLMSAAAIRIGQDPLSDITDLTSQAERVDPAVAKSMREYKDYVSTLSHKVYDDPETTANLYDDIYQGRATSPQITALVRQGKLSPDKAPFALRDMEEAEKHRELLNDPSINRAIEETGSTIAGGEFVATAETKAKALEAKNLLRQGVIQYQTKHPDASRVEAYGEVIKNQQIILKGLGLGQQQLPPGTVNGVLGTPAASAPAPAAPAAKSLYATPEALKAAIKEHNDTQGGGRLAIQAEALGLSVPEFINAQVTLLRKPATKK